MIIENKQLQTLEMKRIKRAFGFRQYLNNTRFTLSGRDMQSRDFNDNKGFSIGRNIRMNHVISRNDASIVYTGTWADEAVGTLYHAGRRRSSVVGDYFEITFFGGYIGLFLGKATDVGKVIITIDGIVQSTVDLYDTVLRERYIAYETSSISAGKHVLRATVETKNASSSANNVAFEGYTLNQDVALKIQNLSCEMYAYQTSQTTDANGYVKFTISTPSGYSVYEIVGVRLTEAVMSDAISTDPKISWRTGEMYLYNGAALTSYDVVVTLLISKV